MIQNELLNVIPATIEPHDIYFACIGTDRSTGDCLGPLVGTFLKEKGLVNVIGTLDDPLHAVNLVERLKEIPEGKFVVAIDASLGKVHNVGKIKIHASSLKPGSGVGKVLPEVGDVSITPVVNVCSDFIPYVVLQNTRLSIVMDLAKKISVGIAAFMTYRTLNGGGTGNEGSKSDSALLEIRTIG